MNSDFESFRRERNFRRQQTRTTERPSGHTDVWEQIEAQERNEMKNELLNAEVDDFFSEATRLAAQIVQKVASSHEEAISDQLRREMEEFLCESIRHATNMVMSLDWKRMQQGGESIVEPNLKNLLERELDAFRAEGTARLADKHLGQDPFDTGLGAELGESKQPAPPPTLAETEHAVARDRSGGASPSDAAAVELDDDDIGGPRIRLSDDELSVNFDSRGESSGTFQAVEFDTRSADAAASQRPQQPVVSDDEDDLPLAASFATEPEADDEPASAQPTDSELEALAADHEPPAADQRSDEEIRRALLMLVDQGIMTPEQARAAYRKQTQ